MELQPGFVEVKTIQNTSGTRVLVIFKRPDGLFGYAGERLTIEGDDVYWEPSDFSGLYDSAEAAEQGALGEIDWLSGLSPN